MPFDVGNILGTLFDFIVRLVQLTWWIVLPLFLFLKVKPLYLKWKRSNYLGSLDWVNLEIGLPQDVLKTPKAMENVLEGLHGAWSKVDLRSKWSMGKVPDYFSLEMIGTNGDLRFIVRAQRQHRNFVESKIYSQYPDAEITEIDDYTEDLPPDLPGREYDLWGGDFELSKDAPYPLKTYIDFEDVEEERRLDPVSQFAENISKMEEGEHLWLQFLITPVLTEIEGEANKVRDELAGRKSSSSSGFGPGIVQIISDFFVDLIRAFAESAPDLTREYEGRQKTSQESIDIQKLTPGEQRALEKVEMKASKLHFHTNIRALYLARKDVWKAENIASLNGFFKQFTAYNMLQPNSQTIPSSSLMFFQNKRNYLRKRRAFVAYKKRMFGSSTKPYALNVEELATLYHLPGRVVSAPFMPRKPSKTSEPPRGLPT